MTEILQNLRGRGFTADPSAEVLVCTGTIGMFGALCNEYLTFGLRQTMDISHASAIDAVFRRFRVDQIEPSRTHPPPAAIFQDDKREPERISWVGIRTEATSPSNFTAPIKKTTKRRPLYVKSTED